MARKQDNGFVPWKSHSAIRHERDRLKALNAELVRVLAKVRQACLFSENDGRIGVTTDPCIDEQLFNDIQAAIAEARE